MDRHRWGILQPWLLGHPIARSSDYRGMSHARRTQETNAQQENKLNTSIDYYFAPQSPWTYLGHARFEAIAKAANAVVRVLPADFGKIFAISGGLPLLKRAPQRQAYRLLELARFSDFLKLPLNVQPRYFSGRP